MKKVIFLFLAIITFRQNNNPCLFAEGITERGNLSYLDNIIQEFTPNTNGILNNWRPSYATDNEIGCLDKSQLRLIRNTIYARHGYIFNSIDLQEHFSRFSWYNGIKTNVNDELTVNEWRVINLLIQMENNYPSFDSNEIMGVYVSNDFWETRSDQREMRLWPNGFLFYQPEKYENSFYGLWSFDGNIFKVTIFFVYIYPEIYIFNPNIHHNIYTSDFQKYFPSWMKLGYSRLDLPIIGDR
jgi:hypothetical protein